MKKKGHTPITRVKNLSQK